MNGPFDDLDLYAGAGGWDEGARMLGRRSIGLEIWHDACASAKRAGHPRVQCDIATYPTAPFVGRTTGLIASPPCQAWSQAGNRLGELDREHVHDLVDAYARGTDDPGDGWHDPRSHHAAQPVRWIRELRPEWVALEQVPEAIDLWRHIGDTLRGWGYSVVAEVLNSADYGVPQTRRRAILIASRSRAVVMPEPTHYDDSDSPGLFGTPWMSMADALGWSSTAHRRPLVQRSNYNSGNRGDSDRKRAVRTLDEPSGTVTSKGFHWAHPADPQDVKRSARASVREAALLQSFPADYPWVGNKTSQLLQVGNAIPPRLAAAVIGAATGADWQTSVAAHYDARLSEVAA